MLVCLVVGNCFSLLFHLGTTESSQEIMGVESKVVPLNNSAISCLDWLKEYQFYLVTIDLNKENYYAWALPCLCLCQALPLPLFMPLLMPMFYRA